MPAWIPVVVVVVAIGLYAVVRLFGIGGKKSNLVADAKARTEDIKTAADAQLAAELKKSDADVAELDQIKEIDDDETRLIELAKYANRRRQ